MVKTKEEWYAIRRDEPALYDSLRGGWGDVVPGATRTGNAQNVRACQKTADKRKRSLLLPHLCF